MSIFETINCISKLANWDFPLLRSYISLDNILLYSKYEKINWLQHSNPPSQSVNNVLLLTFTIPYFKNWLPYRKDIYTLGKETVSSKMVLVKLDGCKDPYLPPWTNLNSKWIKDLNARLATLSLVEEKLGNGL